MTNKVPLFETTATDAELVNSDWCNYIISNFENRRNFQVLSIKALDYNSKHGKSALGSSRLMAFKTIINKLHDSFPATKFPDIIEFVDEQLIENYDILNKLYDGDHQKILDSFMSLRPQTNLQLFNYLAYIIYTPEFSEHCIYFSRDQFISKTNMFLPELKNNTFKSEKQNLNFLVSTLNVLNIQAKLYIDKQLLVEETKLRDALIIHFEDKYPEKYNKYKLLQELELDITPTELAYQLHSCDKIESYSLPELI